MDPASFEDFAKEVNQKLEEAKVHPYVRLRIVQVSWEVYIRHNVIQFNDIYITLPKKTTIFRLQCEIATCLQRGSVTSDDMYNFRIEL